jgi:hypothetical protein
MITWLLFRRPPAPPNLARVRRILERPSALDEIVPYPHQPSLKTPAEEGFRRCRDEDSGMRRALPDLSRRLLRKGVERLAAERDTCSVCHRTPLVGERVHLYANGSLACALCREHKAGEPEHSHLVHHSEWGHAVKPLARARIAA